MPCTTASTADLLGHAIKAQGGDEHDHKSDSVRVDSSSFKFLGTRSICTYESFGSYIRQSCLLRLCYPSLKQNVSHAELLPNFVDVVSRKIDNTQKVLVTSLQLVTSIF